MAQGIDRDMDLRAFAAFGAIVGGPVATFGTGLKRPTVQDGSMWLGRAIGDFA